MQSLVMSYSRLSSDFCGGSADSGLTPLVNVIDNLVQAACFHLVCGITFLAADFQLN